MRGVVEEECETAVQHPDEADGVREGELPRPPQLIPVFCGRGIERMSKTAEEDARVFRVVRE
jgi:hypothetical protein